MSEGYDLSFKNKEVRMYIYLFIPTLIIIGILIYYGELNYSLIFLLAFYTIFYIWRYFYRGKWKKEGEKPS